MVRQIVLLAILVSLVLSGCGVIPAAVYPSATATSPAAAAVSSPEPAQGLSTTVAATEVLQPTGGAPQPPERERSSYRLQVELDYDQRLARVRQEITARNPADSALEEILLVVDANRQPGIFSLTAMQWSSGQPIAFHQLDGARLRIPLDQPLPVGEKFSLQLSYELHLPQFAGWLGFTGRQINLGDWYPYLPPYDGQNGWLVHNQAMVGEYLAYEAVDYQVSLTLLPAAQPLVVAASAPAAGGGRGNYEYLLPHARGFALSISPEFQTLQDGPVTIYYFKEHAQAAKASLQTARQALDLYSSLFAPYPYPGLSVIEADFFDGMEYSGLFFLGAEYFAAYPGSPQSYLTALSAHETAHQWWYGLVGNDPAQEPWLDEALCTYSELFYYEKYLPEYVDWWRSYRITRFEPGGWVDSTIYRYDNFRSYVNAVYLRGAQFLDDLRALAGEEQFLLVLRSLAVDYQNRIISTQTFFDLLAQKGVDANRLRKAYFEQ